MPGHVDEFQVRGDVGIGQRSGLGDVAARGIFERRAHPALTRGRQQLRFAGDKPGLFAVSRFDPVAGNEYLIAFNSSPQPWTGNIEVETGSAAFTALAGTCPAGAAAPGSIALSLPAFGYAVCAAGKPQ